MATFQNFVSSHRPTVGLLTTVADLPPHFKLQYVKPESPLDLSVKPNESPITPPSTPSPERKKRRILSETESIPLPDTDEIYNESSLQEVTPNKPIKSISTIPKTAKHQKTQKVGKHKAVRKLKFDENKSSPVSGTIIRSLEDISDDGVVLESGDIDPEYNIVEVTDEAKAEIAAIPNVIGSYACKLCRNEFEDVFGLARHKCSCIVLLEYRCPECGKRFNCPANLASHRRWHKPKDDFLKKKENSKSSQQFLCTQCGKYFKRQAYLRKHLATHKGNIEIQFVPRSSDCSESYNSENSSSNDSIISSNMKFNNKDSENEILTTYTSLAVSQRIFENAFTEEENIAAAALAHLRNGPSVIRHTALTV